MCLLQRKDAFEQCIDFFYSQAKSLGIKPIVYENAKKLQKHKYMQECLIDVVAKGCEAIFLGTRRTDPIRQK